MRVGDLGCRSAVVVISAFLRTSYWSPLVTMRSPWSFVWTSIHAIIHFMKPSFGLSGNGRQRQGPYSRSRKTVDLERDRKSDKLGTVSMGGRNVVEHKPDVAEMERVLVLAIDHIVWSSHIHKFKLW